MRHNVHSAIVAAFCLFSPLVAFADDETLLPFTPGSVVLMVPPRDQPDTPPPAAPLQIYGKAGTSWWTIGTAIGADFNTSTDFNINAAWSNFLADDLEFITEGALWYHSQPDDDAESIGLAGIFRWHFYDSGPWTLYTDLGIGVLLSTDNVPARGTSFNFTPRFGIGFTRALNDAGDVRLEVGLRWAHISNARIYGHDQNPGRDDALLYAGVIFPF